MSTLSEIYIKKEVLEVLVNTLNRKTGEDAKGVKIQISISDTTNDYGQNVSATISQTKEQREQKIKPYYVGNGKVFWTNGKIEVAKKKEDAAPPVQNAITNDGDDSLPF